MHIHISLLKSLSLHEASLFLKILKSNRDVNLHKGAGGIGIISFCTQTVGTEQAEGRMTAKSKKKKYGFLIKKN
jgi:hypothetical protein